MCLGIPGKVVEIDEERGTTMGTVDFGGIRKRVCLAYVPDIQLGEYTIVHVGFAITRIDEASATQTLEMFRELGLLEEELGESSQGPAGAPDCPAPATWQAPS
jgi:hydrogenase expression/formation protein HypC